MTVWKKFNVKVGSRNATKMSKLFMGAGSEAQTCRNSLGPIFNRYWEQLWTDIFTARNEVGARLYFHRRLGGCVVALGGGGGGMCHCSQKGMHVCLGVHGCSGGGHAWLLWGGMHGCSGGACMVAPGGHAWLLLGGMHGIWQDTEIRSMSGRYASYWNAFL